VLAVVPLLEAAAWKGTSIPETLIEIVRAGNAAFPFVLYMFYKYFMCLLKLCYFWKSAYSHV